MNAPTQKLTTPIAKLVIEIKGWITGEEAEYVDDALMSKVDVKPNQSGKADFGKMDVATALTEQVHREIEKFIVSIDGHKEKVLDTVLKLPEEDYTFIQKEINSRRKKKLIPSEKSQPTP